MQTQRARRSCKGWKLVDERGVVRDTEGGDGGIVIFESDAISKERRDLVRYGYRSIVAIYSSFLLGPEVHALGR